VGVPGRCSGYLGHMTRRRLGFVTFGLLAALFVLAAAVPIGGAVGVLLFALVVVLVGVWFFRFGPDGDLWEAADEWGINPWWAIGLVLLLGAAWLAFRVGLLNAA
jgi:hypothetical protein